MSRENLDQMVEWCPELSPEAQAYAEELRAQTRPQLTFVRDFRQAFGLSQIEMAELLGMTQSNVSKTERKNDIPISSLITIARAKHKHIKIVVENEHGKQEDSFSLA